MDAGPGRPRPDLAHRDAGRIHAAGDRRRPRHPDQAPERGRRDDRGHGGVLFARLRRLRDGYRGQLLPILRHPVRRPGHPDRRHLAFLPAEARDARGRVPHPDARLDHRHDGAGVGHELFSIALYIASGFARNESRSQEAAAKYLLVGGFASAFVLYGMALVYGASGTTLIPEIAKRIGSSSSGDPLLILGILLMGVGFAFKVSAAPFHMWTPDVYQGAPIPVTAFMSVGTKAAAFAMIVRVFAGGLPHLAPEWQALLAFVAATSMVVGNLMAITQSSLKPLLAYSGIAQAGYVLIGVIAGGKIGLAAVLYYLFVYMFMNFGAFAIVTLLAGPDGDRDRLSDLSGLYRRNWPMALIMSVVSVYYYVRVLVPVWSTTARAEPLRASPSSTLAIALSGVLSVVLGLYPTTLLVAAQFGALPYGGP